MPPFNVGAVANPHIVGRHEIVAQARRDMQQMRRVAAQLVDHVFKGVQPWFIRLGLFGCVDGLKRRAEFCHIMVDLAVSGVGENDKGKFLRQCC